MSPASAPPAPGSVPARRVSSAPEHRGVPWAVPIAAVIVFALLPAVVRVTVLGSADNGTFADVTSARDLLIAQLVALAVVVLVITLIRWWRPVLQEPRRDRHWVWGIPAVMVVASLAVTDWSRLATMGAGFQQCCSQALSRSARRRS